MTRRFNTARKIGCALTFAISVFSMSTTSYADYTEEQKRLCLNDMLKFCMSALPDDAKVNACMTLHTAQLSPECKAVAPTPPSKSGASKSGAPTPPSKSPAMK